MTVNGDQYLGSTVDFEPLKIIPDSEREHPVALLNDGYKYTGREVSIKKLMANLALLKKILCQERSENVELGENKHTRVYRDLQLAKFDIVPSPRSFLQFALIENVWSFTRSINVHGIFGPPDETMEVLNDKHPRVKAFFSPKKWGPQKFSDKEMASMMEWKAKDEEDDEDDEDEEDEEDEEGETMQFKKSGEGSQELVTRASPYCADEYRGIYGEACKQYTDDLRLDDPGYEGKMQAIVARKDLYLEFEENKALIKNLKPCCNESETEPIYICWNLLHCKGKIKFHCSCEAANLGASRRLLSPAVAKFTQNKPYFCARCKKV